MYKQISVHAKDISVQTFNALCDKLSELRHWCGDYRQRNDFNPHTECRYWHTRTFLEYETDLITASYEGVIADIKTFCEKHRLDFDTAIEVKILTVEP